MTHALDKAKLKRSELYRVFSGETEYPVFRGHDYHFVHLTTRDIVALTVSLTKKTETLAILPSRRGKICTRDGDSFGLLVSKGDYLTLIPDKDRENPLIVLADEPSIYGQYEGCTLLRYASGSYTYIGNMTVGSDTVVILEEGAVVEGSFKAENASNIRILGGGILLYDRKPVRPATPLFFNYCKNIEVRGITILGFHTWNLHVRRSKGVIVENLKIMAHEVWSDGIDIVSCEDVLVRHIYIKNEDDCVCIKSSDAASSNFDGRDARNILVEDCILWNGPRGNSLEIGYETNNSVVENILFRDVDVLYRETQQNKFNRSILSIHNSGNAEIRKILYENIYAQSSEECFVMIAHMHQPSWGTGTGHIENIIIRNLTLAGGEIRPSKISAIAEVSHEKCITKGIHFENLTVLGQRITTQEQAEAVGFAINAEDVTFC